MFKEPVEVLPNVNYTACATLKVRPRGSVSRALGPRLAMLEQRLLLRALLASVVASGSASFLGETPPVEARPPVHTQVSPPSAAGAPGEPWPHCASHPYRVLTPITAPKACAK